MTAILFLVLRIFLSVLLYTFIFLVLFFIWKDSYIFSTIISQSRIPTINLTITSPTSNTETRIFNREEITIGRASNSDLSLNEEVISNHHARLIFHHMQWWIEDLDSRNGTLINGQRINTSTVITSGDELLIGNYKIQISILDDLTTVNSDKEIRRKGE